MNTTDPRAIYADLSASNAQGAVALLFQLLTAARPGEVLSLTRNDLCVERALWTIPAEKSKSRKPRSVPLSRQALVLLPADGANDDTPIFKASMPNLRRFVTSPYDFRSMFRAWCDSRHNADITMHCIGHGPRQYFFELEQQATIMQEWADYSASEIAMETAASA